MYGSRDGRLLRAKLLSQVRSGLLSPEQAQSTLRVFLDVAPFAPLLAIVRAPQTWADLSSRLPFNTALDLFQEHLGNVSNGGRQGAVLQQRRHRPWPQELPEKKLKLCCVKDFKYPSKLGPFVTVDPPRTNYVVGFAFDSEAVFQRSARCECPCCVFRQFVIRVKTKRKQDKVPRQHRRFMEPEYDWSKKVEDVKVDTGGPSPAPLPAAAAQGITEERIATELPDASKYGFGYREGTREAISEDGKVVSMAVKRPENWYTDGYFDKAAWDTIKGLTPRELQRRARAGTLPAPKAKGCYYWMRDTPYTPVSPGEKVWRVVELEGLIRTAEGTRDKCARTVGPAGPFRITVVLSAEAPAVFDPRRIGQVQVDYYVDVQQKDARVVGFGGNRRRVDKPPLPPR